MVFPQPLQLHSNGRKVAVEVTTETAFGLGKIDVNIYPIFWPNWDGDSQNMKEVVACYYARNFLFLKGL